MTTLAITAAGRAALADQTNVGVGAVRLTHLELGDGRRGVGDDDDARTALRSRRVRGPVAGREAAGGRVACVLDVAAPGWTGDVTEIGLVAGDGADELLLAYWAAAGEDAPFAAHASTRLVVGVTLDVSDASADVDVTVSPAVTFGASEAALAALEARVAALEQEAPMEMAMITLTGAAEGEAASVRVALVDGNVDGFAVAANGLSWTVPAGKWLVEANANEEARWHNTRVASQFGAVDGGGARLLLWPQARRHNDPHIQSAIVTLAAATSYTAETLVGGSSGAPQMTMTWRRIGDAA